MNKKFILSTAFMLMLWQGAFAGAPEFSEKPNISTTVQPQGPLLGNMPLDTMVPLLRNFSFKEGWKFLGVNRIHHDHIGVWTIFANLHGYDSVTKDTTTAEKIREVITEESKNTLRAAMPSGDASLIPTSREMVYLASSVKLFTAELMVNLLQIAQEKPFLWDMLITILRDNQKALRELSLLEWQWDINSEASFGYATFKNVSVVNCRAYLVAVAAYRNPDGTPGVGAENAQMKLNFAADGGRLGFTNDRGTVTSGYDYLVTIAARKNPDGTPGVGSENAQMKLNDAAYDGRLGYTEIAAYHYLRFIAARTNLDGTPGLGAEHALIKLSKVVFEEKLGDTENSAYESLFGPAMHSIHDGASGVESTRRKLVFFEKQD